MERPINVSEEYLELLCDQMLKWSEKPDSFIFAQFLDEYEVGYPFFKYFVSRSDMVCNVFERVKARLCTKWLEMGLYDKKLSPHKAKILHTMIRLYDSYRIDVEREDRGSDMHAKVAAEMAFASERYNNEELEEPYKGLYERNADKCRSKA